MKDISEVKIEIDRLMDKRQEYADEFDVIKGTNKKLRVQYLLNMIEEVDIKIDTLEWVLGDLI